MLSLMTRVVNNKSRYYNIYIEKNLFDQYIVTKEYGSLIYKKPTKVIYSFFDTLVDASKYLMSEQCRKIKRGYKLKGVLNEYK